MVTTLRRSPEDALDPHLRLEAVNGSEINCYGKKDYSIRLGRKTYHIQAVISDTSETILGMDFIKKYRLDFRWGEFGDYYLYDPISNSYTLCEFVRTSHTPLRLASLAISATRKRELFSKSEAAFQSFAISSLKELAPESIPKNIPLAYQKLIKEFSSILTPDFKTVKHNITHAIPTGDSPPVRSKVRPLLPGSPKAVAGHAAWQQMIELGIVESQCRRAAFLVLSLASTGQA